MSEITESESSVNIDLELEIAQLEWEAEAAEHHYRSVLERTTTTYFERIFPWAK